MKYFAYGSNLNLSDLKKFRNGQGESFVNSLKISDQIFFLPDHELAFQAYSNSRDGGILNVKQMKGHVVAGKIYEIPDLGLLELKEGAPNFYKKINVKVFSEDGSLEDAITYVLNEELVKDFVKPNSKYVDIVLQGYSDFKINSKYPFTKINLINSSLNKKTLYIDRIFVYGTLRKTQSRQHVMDNLSTKLSHYTLEAKMYDVGSYPGIVLGGGKAFGEIHTVKPEAFEKLDTIENFVGYDEDSLFIRVLVNSQQGLFWTYVLNQKTNDLKEIPSGDWVNRFDIEESNINNFKKSVKNSSQLAISNFYFPKSYLVNKLDLSGNSEKPLLKIFLDGSDRMWLKAKYFDISIKPIGKIKILIPNGPFDPDMILEALLVFAPVIFESCPTIKIIKDKLKDKQKLQLDGSEVIPTEWNILLQEAKMFFNKNISIQNDIIKIK